MRVILYMSIQYCCWKLVIDNTAQFDCMQVLRLLLYEQYSIYNVFVCTFSSFLNMQSSLHIDVRENYIVIHNFLSICDCSHVQFELSLYCTNRGIWSQQYSICHGSLFHSFVDCTSSLLQPRTPVCWCQILCFWPVLSKLEKNIYSPVS